MISKIHITANNCEEFRQELLKWLKDNQLEPWYDSERSALNRHARQSVRETYKRAFDFWKHVVIDERSEEI